MKKFFMFLAVAGLMAFSANVASAQEDSVPVASEVTSLADLTAAQPEVPLHQALKTKFIEGGPEFMSLIILCLILGLALSIERILYLTFSKTNTKKLLADVEKALENGGVEAAKDVCRNTRGPVASIFYQGLSRYDEGIDVVEKTVLLPVDEEEDGGGRRGGDGHGQGVHGLIELGEAYLAVGQQREDHGDKHRAYQVDGRHFQGDRDGLPKGGLGEDAYPVVKADPLPAYAELIALLEAVYSHVYRRNNSEKYQQNYRYEQKQQRCGVLLPRITPQPLTE